MSTLTKKLYLKSHLRSLRISWLRTTVSFFTIFLLFTSFFYFYVSFYTFFKFFTILYSCLSVLMRNVVT